MRLIAGRDSTDEIVLYNILHRHFTDGLNPNSKPNTTLKLSLSPSVLSVEYLPTVALLYVEASIDDPALRSLRGVNA